MSGCIAVLPLRPFLGRPAGVSAHAFGADTIVVAFGAGVDSTAMLIGLRDRRVPIAVILEEGLPLPMKSACWMCPAPKKPEVDWLAQTHPDLAEMAMVVERLAHEPGLTTTRGLGRRWSWSEYLDQGDPAVVRQ